MTEIIAGDCNWRARKNVTMTEEELRERLFRTISLLHLEGWETETVIDAIYAHFREAGYKSPEEVEGIACPHEKECIAYMTLGEKK